MKTMLRLWNEETGAILSAEVMLVASVLVIGVIAGLASVRDSVTTELADLAQALGNINQSFSFSGTQGHHEINLRLVHVSNGGIRKPNPGQDFGQLRYVYWF